MSVREPASVRPVRFAFYMALVMGVAPLLNFALTALGPVLVSELELSATAFGALWFVTFGIAGLFTVLGGKLSDAFGPRRLVTGVFILALLGVLVAAGAASYWWLVLGVALSGLAQSVSNPATNALISTRVPKAKQGLVVGIKQSGVQAGQVLAGLALPTLALLLGWRAALLACGVVSLAGLALTVRMVPADGPRRRWHGSGKRVPLAVAVRWMTLYAFLMGAVTQATNVYLPLYAHLEFAASVTKAGFVVVVLGGVAIVARMVWASLAKDARRVHLSLLGVAGLACVALTALFLALAVGEWLMWLGAGLFGFSALAANVLIMLAVVRMPSTEVGRATGWASAGLFVGFMVGPVAFGRLVDVASFGTAWLAFLAVTLSAGVATCLWWWQDRRSAVVPAAVEHAA